jgi:molybdate transport system substrate-binding protein
VRGVVASVVSAAVLTGCAAAGGASSPPKTTTTITVVAAASLTEAFEQIGRRFEATHPGTIVRFSFGPSDGLAAQIQAGAPADVFASASPTWMDAVADDPGVADRFDFARNRLVVVTPADDPADIDSVDDLAHPGVKLVLAAEGVPAGDYAREMLGNARIAGPALTNVVSNEEDVKAVIQKVLLGEADAGIVYVTDVTPDVRDRVREIAIPNGLNVVATYPIAVVDGSARPGLAREFVAFVSDPGSGAASILHRLGFLPPG